MRHIVNRFLFVWRPAILLFLGGVFVGIFIGYVWAANVPSGCFVNESLSGLIQAIVSIFALLAAIFATTVWKRQSQYEEKKKALFNLRDSLVTLHRAWLDYVYNAYSPRNIIKPPRGVINNKHRFDERQVDSDSSSPHIEDGFRNECKEMLKKILSGGY